MDSRSRVSAWRVAALAALALAGGAGSAPAGDPGPSAPALPGLAPGAAADVETVTFADPHRAPVRVVRGPAQPSPPLRAAARPIPPPARPAGAPVTREVVSFGTGFASEVTVIRGASAIPASFAQRIDPAGKTRAETVRFADPLLAPVTVLRGPVMRSFAAVDLFGPPNGGVLDRVAFAVDGVESRHGADPRMWRPELNGPQGPMQVSAAAAFDVGGGDRFDLRQNRLLGRAYLAQMYERYGNWPDAVAAYNWGPGSMDQWIAGGRRADQLPPGVAWYVDLVLRHALIAGR